MKEVIINSKDMKWKDNPNSPHGLSSKILRDEGGTRTILLKFPKGVTIDTHKHSNTEQHFIVKGQYETGGKTYGPGFYRLIPAGSNHGPFTSETGAEVLVIWH
jgi:anti-sigma factor ChrR (cupin superfamily)